MSNAVLKTRPVRRQSSRLNDEAQVIARKSPLLRVLPNEAASARVTTTAPSHAPWYRSEADELVHAITHGAGLALAVAGALVMAWTVITQGDAWRIAGCGMFLASLVGVYGASTLSHCSFPRWKSFLRRVDQGVIYFLVVATYTPFGLAYMRTGAGWLLLAALWTGAFAGFFSKVLFAHRVDTASIWSYVVLGVLPTITIPWLWPMVPAGTAAWMFVGGMFYLLGTIFLINDARVRHFHAVWHLLVIAGSVCHFMAILAAVARAGS
jgi:hemolysin III